MIPTKSRTLFNYIVSRIFQLVAVNMPNNFIYNKLRVNSNTGDRKKVRDMQKFDTADVHTKRSDCLLVNPWTTFVVCDDLRYGAE